MIDEIVVPKDVVADLIHCIRVLTLMIAKMPSTQEQVEKTAYVAKVLDRAIELFNKK